MKHMHYCLGLFFVLCLPCMAVSAEDLPDADAPLEFVLPPVREGFRVSPIRTRDSIEVVFKKEPVYAGDTVYRNLLRFGEGPMDYIGVAYDVSAKKLYIDRNRNLDLTDDGPGIASEEGLPADYARFPVATIELVHGDVTVPYEVQINFYDEYFDATIQSGWQGDVEIAGKRCSMGMADNLDGVFDGNDGFRFDHEGHQEVRLPYGRANQLRMPRWIYFEGHSYHIQSAFRVVDGETALAVVLHPVTDDLMDIAFEGQYVSRVLLVDDDSEFGLLDWPRSAMRIPRGAYHTRQVDLLDSFRAHLWGARMKPVQEDTVLEVGGPLKQKVSAWRSGSDLQLGFTLVGVDEMQYFPDERYENHAEFAIYRGDQKIHTDQFEYG